MAAVSVFDDAAEVAADGSTGIWARYSRVAVIGGTNTVSVIDARNADLRVLDAIPSVLVEQDNPRYWGLVRLVIGNERFTLRITEEATDFGSIQLSELTDAAEADLRFAFKYKESTLVVRIEGDFTNAYVISVSNGVALAAFAQGIVDDADNATELTTFAVLDGGDGTPVNFDTLTIGEDDAAAAASPAALGMGLALGSPVARDKARPGALEIGLALGRADVRNLSIRYAQALRESAPADRLLTALEIEHPAVAQPVRVINDTEGRTIEGNDYVAFRFDARLADDVDGQAPQAELGIDNVGRELTQWVEAAQGGTGATVRVMLVLDIDDPPVEWEVTLDVATMNVDQERVTARLGFDPLLGRAAVALRHDPQTSPGLF